MLESTHIYAGRPEKTIDIRNPPALDVSRLGETVMTIHGDKMWPIDDALELVLGLN